MPPRHKLYLLPPLSLIPKPLAELALLAHWHMSFLSHMCGFRGGGSVVVVVVVVVVVLFQLQPARLLLG